MGYLLRAAIAPVLLLLLFVALLQLTVATASGAGAPIEGGPEPCLSFPHVVDYSAATAGLMTSGDLDNDGDHDIAVAGGGVSVLLNAGDGTFAAHVTYGNVGVDVAMGDLNGDGFLDLAGANGAILLNVGDGTFAPGVTYGVGSDPFSVVIGDLDRDGDRDVVVSNRGSNDVSILFNDGDGTFAPDVRYAVGTSPRDVALGDLDGDGAKDLVTANEYNDDISVLLNNGHGIFAPAVTYEADNHPVSVAIGDLDGDGDRDVALANLFADVTIYLNAGNGALTYGGDYEARGPMGLAIFSLVMGDLEGDGDRDLAVTDGGYISVLLNNGDATFPADLDFAVGDYSTEFTEALAIKDLNGDGNLDFAVSAHGAAGFNVAVLLSACPPVCLAADLDGSGEVDLADLLSVLSTWGRCPACPEDIDGDGQVGFQDLLRVLGSWGPCP